MDIIVSHINSDFDSLAAMVAAKKIYPEAEIVLTGSLNRNVREFLTLHGDVIEIKEFKRIKKNEIKRIIVVDTKVAERLGEAKNIIKKKGVEVFTFDHHPKSEHDMEGSKDYSEPTGAATTILIKIIRDKRIYISPFEATLFALGIHEDTGSLTYPTTTYDDVEALSFLMLNKANMEVINGFLNLTLTKNQHDLLNKLLNSMEKLHYGGVDIVISEAKVKEFIDGASVIAHKLCDLENADVVITFLQSEDRLHIIARSRVKEISVSNILEKFGGGGHPQAASAVVKKYVYKEIKETIKDLIKDRLENPLNAKDIMSSPVRTIDASLPIEKASKIMIKYGHSGIPVVEKDKIIGLLSRGDIDKAVFHGLSHAPAKGFMSRKIFTVKPDISLYDLQKLLVEKDIGRLPVIEEGKVIGIVTRTDVLRALHGIEYIAGVKDKIESKIKKNNVIEKMKRVFDKEFFKTLKEIGLMGDRLGLNVYMVGGIVRDILLEYENLDLDIVVEGDGIGFAKKLSKKLRGRCSSHKKFGTSVIILPDGLRIDVASARTEYYEHPAALPEVEISTIRHDLARRDFTVNSMAIFLNSKHYGALLDYFGGMEDLNNKKIRVLYSLSFVEDPTRILRAVRFEQRYEFRLDSHTEKLLEKAIDMDLIGHIMGVRLKEELIYILQEEDPFKAMNRLKELKIIKYIHPKLKIDSETKKIFKSINTACVELFKLKEIRKKWLVYIMALLKDLSLKEIIIWTEILKLKKREIEIITETKKAIKGKNISRLRKKGLKNSEIYLILNKFKEETLIYLYAISVGEKKRAVKTYVNKLRNVKIYLNGDDLIKMGYGKNKHLGDTLKVILRSRLDREIKSKKEEIDLAKKLTRGNIDG